jgi:hypothetical protein
MADVGDVLILGIDVFIGITFLSITSDNIAGDKL